MFATILEAIIKSAEPKLVSFTVRVLLIGIGVLCVILGFVGLAVPLMPGFVFFGIAVICLSSASPTLRRKLASYPNVGRFLQELEETRGLELKLRVSAGFRSALRLLGGSKH